MVGQIVLRRQQQRRRSACPTTRGRATRNFCPAARPLAVQRAAARAGSVNGLRDTNSRPGLRALRSIRARSGSTSLEGSRLFERISASFPSTYPTRVELSTARLSTRPEIGHPDRRRCQRSSRSGAGREPVGARACSMRCREAVRLPTSRSTSRPITLNGAAARWRRPPPPPTTPGSPCARSAGDFTGALALAAAARRRRVGLLLPAALIGNFEYPADCRRALAPRFAGWIDGGALLIGVEPRQGSRRCCTPHTTTPRA
jgi:hypothetical protein